MSNPGRGVVSRFTDTGTKAAVLSVESYGSVSCCRFSVRSNRSLEMNAAAAADAPKATRC
jgi:hypothetical protein